MSKARQASRIKAKRRIGIRQFDAAEHLRDEGEIIAYLEAALSEDDPKLLTVALGNVARAKGMTEVARKTGLTREALYRALSPAGNPEFATIFRVLHAMGLRLSIAQAA